MKEETNKLARQEIDLTDLSQEELGRGLIQALRLQRWQQAQRFLEAGADVNYHYKYGLTPIQWVNRMTVEQIKFLLAKGADVKSLTDEGQTPLHQIIIKMRVEAQETAEDWQKVVLLLRHGADPTVRDTTYGKTIFDYVVGDTLVKLNQAVCLAEKQRLNEQITKAETISGKPHL